MGHKIRNWVEQWKVHRQQGTIPVTLEKRLGNMRVFWSFFMRDFVEGLGIQNAAALAYTTLLSVVPLMAVSLAIFAAFPVFENVSSQIQDFIFQNFVPTSGDVVRDYIQGFSDKAKSLTGPGIAGLTVTAVMTMATIEKSFNRIWRVPKNRSLMARFFVYWSVLTLGPLMMGVGVAVSSYVVSMPLFNSETASLIGRKLGLLKLIPFFMETMTFSLLYLVVPNTRVPLKNAMAGGVLAAVLFEGAKFCFTYYVTNFPTYENIYGALAVIPIFLVWVYLSWIVAILGAQFAYCLQMYELTGGKPGFTEVSHELGLAYRVLSYLWLGQQQGKTVELADMAEREPEVGAWNVEQVLLVLQAARLVTKSEDGGWVLSRDVSHFTLLDLYHAQPFLLPASGATTDVDGFTSILSQVDRSLENILNVPLVSLFEQDERLKDVPV